MTGAMLKSGSLAMSQVTDTRMSPEVRDAIRRYFSERLKTSVISTSEALKSVRQQAPLCQLSDRHIIQWAVERALEAGFAVNFDGQRPR